MEMKELASSNIQAVGYDQEKRELHVHFRRGGRYVLYAVEPELFEAFVHADSPGKYYNEHLRGAYKFERIGEEPRADSH